MPSSNLTSAVNQYYLQSMGIDLYVERASDLASPEQLAPQQLSPQQQSAQQQSQITLQMLKDSPLIANICRVLAITPAAIVEVADNEFRFGSLLWVFDQRATQVALVRHMARHKLSIPSLAVLSQPEAKRALWACLMPLIKAVVKDK